MSYGPPPPPPQQPPYPGGQPGPGYYPPQQPKKSSAPKIALIIVGGVVALCTVFGIIGAVAGGGEPDPQVQAVAAPATTVPAAPTQEATTAPPTTVATTAPTKPPRPSTPPAPAKLEMPDVKEQNAAVAADALEKAGFTNVQFGSQDEDDKVVLLLQNWTVKKQSAKAGQKLTADTLIVLTCTKN